MEKAEIDEALRQLHEDARLGPLGPVSAKLEILLGLVACALGVVLAIAKLPGATYPGSMIWGATCVILIVLGGFLAMAGHRSHLYQSLNLLTAYLARLLAERDAEKERAQR